MTPITTEAEYEAALSRVDALWDDDAAREELEALAAAVSAYEEARGWHGVRTECPQPRCPGWLDADGECTAPTCRGGR